MLITALKKRGRATWPRNIGVRDMAHAALAHRGFELHRFDDLLAAANVALPLDPSPDIAIWSTKILGPVQDNSVLGPFFNLNEWGLKA